jgi:adenylate kinase
MNIVHFGGAQGVGKTTVLRYLRQDLGERADIELLFSSKELGTLATKAYGKGLKALDSTETRQVQNLFMSDIRGLPYSTILLDSHYVSVTQGKVVALTPDEHVQAFNCHIVLEANPYTILGRRINDDRTKRVLDLPSIAGEIYEERNEAFRLAKQSGARIYIINAEGQVAKIAEAIKSILRNEFDI